MGLGAATDVVFGITRHILETCSPQKFPASRLPGFLFIPPGGRLPSVSRQC
jgi:hypothetical protein